MITVHGLHKRYGDFAALDDISLEVPDGSLTALLALIAFTTLLLMTVVKPRREVP